MLHNIKYELFIRMRAKGLVFWMILFPVALGAFFKISFSNIYDEYTSFSTVPAAVVENVENPVFHTVTDEISKEDNPLLEVTYTDKEEALTLLKEQEVTGIIWLDEEVSLSVASDSIEATILESFLNQYKRQEKIITDTMETNPAALESVISEMNSETESCVRIPLTEGNTDNLLNYYYNLIAMVALFGSEGGLEAAIRNQGNLSAVAARKGTSPAKKSVTLLSSLISACIVQALCCALTVTYVNFILKINFGGSLPFVYLSGLIGSVLGVSLGFMIGSIGKAGENAKTGICMAVSLASCFFSGLMVNTMKPMIIEKAPWFNDINPAALISDAFYCLNVYSDYSRYIQKNITMIILSVLMAAIGFILTRRRKYASL